MKTNIRATTFTLTPAITSHIDKRLEKVARLLGSDPSVQYDIELSRTSAHHQKGDVYRAEMHIVGKGKNLYASAEHGDLYSAIDDVRDEILRELKAGKEKRMAFIRRGGAKVKAMMKGLWSFKKPWGKRGL